MAREYGRVWVSIWSDPDFLALSSGPQRLYLLLISQPQMNTCGVQSYAPRRWASLAPDTSVRQVERWIAALEEPRMVVVDRDTDELLIRGHIRHDRAVRTSNVAKALARTWKQVASPVLQRLVLIEVQRLFDECGDNDWPGWKVDEIRELIQLPIGPPSERPFGRRSA